MSSIAAQLEPGPTWPSPTYEQFPKHATSFGADCVVDTAKHYLTRRELLLLKLRCSELKPIKRADGHRVPECVGKSPTVEERRELIRLLTAEGHTSAEVSAMTGYSGAQVGRSLAECGQEAA